MLNSPINAILFDMDGTLFDTETLYQQQWITTAAEFGKSLPSEIYQGFTGVHADICHQIAEDFFGKGFPMDEFIARKHQNNLRAKQALKFKPGAQAFLNHCIQQKMTIGLVTSTARAEVIDNFNRHQAQYNYLDYFQTIIAGEDVKQPKPNPEPYLMACQHLTISPANTLVFEDSNAGCQSAITAGCQTIMIPDLKPSAAHIQDQLTATCASFIDVFTLPMFKGNSSSIKFSQGK